MSRRAASWLAWGAFALTLAQASVSYVLIGISETTGDPTRFSFQGFDGALSLIFALCGAVLASRRPENPIGWILCVSGVLGGFQAMATEYGTYAYFEGHGSRTLGHIGAWVPAWLWIPVVIPLVTFVLLLFPNGRLRSPRWRVVAWPAAAGMALGMVGFALVPRIPGDFEVGNPFGLTAEQPWATLGYLGLLPILPVGIASAISVILRFREARGEERAQLKWLAYFGGIATALSALFGPWGWEPGENLVVLGFLLIPVAIAISVLRYRLYDIDIVINKTVVYGALAGFIALVYVAVVVGIGSAIGRGSDEPNVGLSILATAIVALAFQPLRQRLQHVANRLVYGKRATPYELLSEFAQRVGETYSTEDVLPRMARAVGEGVGAARADIWLRLGPELRLAASWPGGERDLEPLRLIGDDLPPLEGMHAYPVRDGGELLGALTMSKPRGEPVTPAEDKLLADLAHQAGLILRNVRLTEELRANLDELRASRQRIVSAQDAERRRVERDIHDGAQQQLVAMAVKLRLAEGLVDRDPARVRQMLGDLKVETNSALENLRDLARGIYPPLLADRGLVAAIEAQGRKGVVPLAMESDGVGRYSQEVEAAVYFSVLEALQNIAKYAAASTVTVRLRAANGRLQFEISDDGVGFDPGTAAWGMGLQNMEDRVAALGGSLNVRSAPGEGTTVSGEVPANQLEGG